MNKTHELKSGWILQEADANPRLTCPPFEEERFWRGARPVEVPSSIQAAVLGKEWIYRGRNLLKTGWILDRQWWYRNRFELQATTGHATLAFEGICYEARIWLNGTFLGQHQAIYGLEFDVGGLLRKGANDLVVAVLPAPRLPDGYGGILHHRPSAGSRTAQECLVPTCKYTRYWGNHIPLGIMQPVRLTQHGAVTVSNLFVQTLAISRAGARLKLAAELVNRGRETAEGVLDWSCASGRQVQRFRSGRLCLEPGLNTFAQEFVVKSPCIWWPWELGKSPLYALTATLASSGRTLATGTTAFGIRTIAWARNDNDKPWQNPQTLVVNGRRLYMLGSNLAQAIDSLGYTQAELWKERETIRLARLQGVNVLRVHDAATASRALYRHCDETGLLVMQDCLLSNGWAGPETTRRQVDTAALAHQTGQLVRALRNHPSLCAWTGGNELWSYELPLNHDPLSSRQVCQVQAAVVRRNDPSRRYYGQSPERGKGEAHWYPFGDYLDYNKPGAFAWFPLPDKAHFARAWKKLGVDYDTFARQIRHDDLFYSETIGRADFPDVPTLQRFVAPADFRAWQRDPAALARLLQSQRAECTAAGAAFYLPGETISEETWNLGIPETLEDFAAFTQIARSVIGAFSFGAFRTKMFHNSGNLYWAFNDPLPAVNWGVLDYYLRPKRTFHDLREAMKRVAGFALYDRKVFAAGETLRAALHAVNNRPRTMHCRITAQLWDGALRLLAQSAAAGAVPKESARQLGTLTCRVRDADAPLFLRVLLAADGEPGSELTYWLNCKGVFRRSQLPRTRLAAQLQGDRVVVRNTGRAPAFRVEITAVPGGPGPVPEASGFWLEPGQARAIRLHAVARTPPGTRIRVCAWNSQPAMLSGRK